MGFIGDDPHHVFLFDLINEIKARVVALEQRLEKRIGEQRQRINQLQDERHEMGIKLAHALAAERAEAMERDRLRAEVAGWRECALYDAMMDGPRFKGWDRSALDRMRRRAEQDSWIGATAAAETTPAGATVDTPDGT